MLLLTTNAYYIAVFLCLCNLTSDDFSVHSASKLVATMQPLKSQRVAVWLNYLPKKSELVYHKYVLLDPFQ